MSSYKNIIKTSGLVGFVQLFQMAFALLRNKIIAVLLGTSGFGVWGLYSAFIEIAASFSSLGLNSSGVRQIAKMSEDEDAKAKCIWVFRQALTLFSFVTALLCMIFSVRISQALFQSDDYYIGVIIVSAVIFFNGISSGQIAILNGLREIRKLAISQIIGAVTGSVMMVALVCVLGFKGIPWALLSIAVTLALSSWWYVRSLGIPSVRPSAAEARTELKQLLYVGLGISGAGMVAALMSYMSRVYLSETFTIGAVGVYQACWSISNLYIGIILNAMGVDLLPRLSKIINDKAQVTKVLNEQMELGLLVGGIGVVAILMFSSLILHLFYSAEFISGVDIIRWQVLGVAMRLCAQPFGFALIAKGKPVLYILIQSTFFVGEYFLLRLFSNLYGFDGLGINYCVAYVGYLVMMLTAGRILFGYKPSGLLIKIFIIVVLFIATTWFASMIPTPYRWGAAFALLGTMALWINHYLRKYLDIDIFVIIKNKLSHGK